VPRWHGCGIDSANARQRRPCREACEKTFGPRTEHWDGSQSEWMPCVLPLVMAM
jgi:hypothetical protein